MRFVDRRMHVRGIEPVAVLIGVEEQAALPHLVGGGTDARYEVRRIEGRLSKVGERGSVIRIQHDSASQQISRSASSLCVALLTKSKPVEALGQPALERSAARSACAARVDRFRSSSARRPDCFYFLRGLRAAWLRRHALVRQWFARWAERQCNFSKFRRSRLEPATTESTPRFRRQKLLKASSLTNTSVIRVAKLAEGYGLALNFVHLDANEIADLPAVGIGAPVAATLVAPVHAVSKHQFLATGYSALAPSILSDVGS